MGSVHFCIVNVVVVIMIQIFIYLILLVVGSAVPSVVESSTKQGFIVLMLFFVGI